MTKEVSRRHDVSEWLVRSAAGHAPPGLRERLAEEWLADLSTRRGGLSRWRFALGCHWASRVIAVEQPAMQFAAVGQGRLDVGRPPIFTRRALSLVAVAGLHALVFYACWVSLANTHRAKLIENVQYTPVPDAPRPPPVQPRTSISLNHLKLDVPRPPDETRIDKELDPRPVDAPTATQAGPPSDTLAPPQPRPVPQRLVGGPAAGFPNVDDFYPAAAVRAGEQGSAIVQVCVDARGRLDADPLAVHTSGSATLDAAAVKLAKAGSGHYRPSTEGGHPVASCFAFGVRFQLKSAR